MSQAIAGDPATRQGTARATEGGGTLDTIAFWLGKPRNIRRWYALVAGICAALIVITFLVLIYVMPDGADVEGTVDFYAKYNTLLRVVAAGLALLFLIGTLWSAAFISTLWGADPSRNKVYTWATLISEVLVLGLFFAESGLFAATVLLSGHTSDEILHALHVAVLVSAALLGPVWIPYTLGALLISRRTGLFPSWLHMVSVLVIVIDICTITGVFTLTGPLNGENGLIGAGAGVTGPIIWVGAVIAWETVDWARHRTTPAQTPSTEK